MSLKLWTSTIWLYVMLVLGAAVAIALVAGWESWPAAQKIVALIYILLPFHVWEEWRIPGGFAYQYNWVMGKSDEPDRFPMNQVSDMITVFGAMWFGIILLVVGVTPGILISQTFFAFAEVGMHLMFGYRMHRRFKTQGKRTWYNPGLATALFGFLPLFVWGVAVLWHTPLVVLDWVEAVGLQVILAAITFLPERLLPRHDTLYAFPPGYFARYLET